mgnify:CR=1 FL=1
MPLSPLRIQIESTEALAYTQPCCKYFSQMRQNNSNIKQYLMIYFHFSYMYMGVSVCGYVHMSTASREVRRGHRVEICIGQ